MNKGKRFKVRHLLFVVFIIYFTSTFVVQQFRIADFKRQEAQLKQQMEKAMEEREDLKKEISLLHTDEYIERVARDELGLVKPGEYLYKGVSSPKE
ncbi:MAG: FtsB family cell division protein [Tepidanaerobacteraceae bacterium]|jgi:cell division protein FtsL|nr:septum formation initiator family protein [Thermoanaerobacterales bacterium]